MTIPRMNELSRAWAKRRAREIRDMGIAVAAAFAGKLDQIKAPEPEPAEIQSGDWDTGKWWADESDAVT